MILKGLELVLYLLLLRVIIGKYLVFLKFILFIYKMNIKINFIK